jgi:glycosyltransferase involved in cell wall biosynthesis
MIANGVDLDEVDAAAPAPGAAAPLADSDNAAADTLTVGYVGRLVPGKRVDVLIDAFAALRLARKRLLIIGEGPQQESLQRQAQARGVGAQVTFTGYREDRLQLLASLDVFVLPSESEGIPRCLLEAMAASVPVIASDIPGCRALVRHGETGELFAVGDVAGLAGALQRAAASPAQRLARAAAGRRHVREHYSAAAMAEQYLALYRRLLPS